MVEEVSQEGLSIYETILDTLAPDGRPFGKEPESKKEQLDTYLRMYRGNPEAWADYMRNIVQLVQTEMAEAAPELAAAAHPYNIAQALAMEYSYKMERLFLAEQEKYAAMAEEPGIATSEVPPSIDLVTDDDGGDS